LDSKPLSIVEEIDLRLVAYRMTGNGDSQMADLLRRARDAIVGEEKRIKKWQKEYLRTLGARASTVKHIPHPDCERCNAYAQMKTNYSRKDRANKRDAQKKAQAAA
jgi:hypothetical protein